MTISAGRRRWAVDSLGDASMTIGAGHVSGLTIHHAGSVFDTFNAGAFIHRYLCLVADIAVVHLGCAVAGVSVTGETEIHAIGGRSRIVHDAEMAVTAGQIEVINM